jgi:hypothetical protein
MNFQASQDNILEWKGFSCFFCTFALYLFAVCVMIKKPFEQWLYEEVELAFGLERVEDLPALEA